MSTNETIDDKPRVREAKTFRDSIPTVDKKGNRVWMYPKKPPTGKTAAKTVVNWYALRTYVSWVLLVIMFVGPFIRIHGNPLLMFNLVDRQFSVFGKMFWPQDLNIFAMIMVLGFFMITLFTAVFGRLWCGWACPQTVLMEMVFRKIEYWIEGNENKQRKLNDGPWNAERIRKKTIKLTVFFALSFVIGNWLLMYVIGSERWIAIVSDNPFDHLKGLTAMILFTCVFFAIFARFREQACTFICPYGRFQSVMLDEHSMVVAYDDVRGEGRGKKSGKQTPDERKSSGLGDCVDCHACVRVCPTGIDIRDGIQMECVNCTNCIDACNSVMEKLSFPTGLIRYASLNGIKKQEKVGFTPRLLIYCCLLTVLSGVLVFLLASHQNIEVKILRAQGSLYQTMPDGKVSNLFTVRLLNKTSRPAEIALRLEGLEGEIQIIGDTVGAEAQQIGKSAAFVKLASKDITSDKMQIRIGVYNGEEKVQTIKTNFIAPGGTK